MERLLPQSSFVAVSTRRLKKPIVLWRGAPDAADSFDSAGVYCVPQPYEAAGTFTEGTRIELADRYGGTGVGQAGGSGRCSSWGGVQTKGVGLTPLAAADADRYHSSGTLSLEEACQEVLFGEVFSACLPFGAVRASALVVTGGRFQELAAYDCVVPRQRALVLRPFAIRPAHFMRNLLHVDGRASAGSTAPGLSKDAGRTTNAQAVLVPCLNWALGLQVSTSNTASVLDAGLHELVRRYAWQVAASFAMRLPHGALSASNMALTGQFLDYGVSSHVAAYRRQARSPAWVDPWTEHKMPQRTMTTLRRQLDCYLPEAATAGVVAAKDLAIAYDTHLNQRLAVEMAKMCGLTEDMAQACPRMLVDALLRPIRAIWMRGANEPFVSFRAAPERAAANPPPRSCGRYDLNRVFAVAGRMTDACSVDTALTPVLDDGHLRREFTVAYDAMRTWLRNWLPGVPPDAFDAFIAMQSARKNAEMGFLRRAVLQVPLREMDAAEADGAAVLIARTLAQARDALDDLHPALQGASGSDQVQDLALQPAWRSARPLLINAPAGVG